jgi:hypothetical protein
MILINSFIVGEKIAKEGEGRNFNEFLKTISKKRK